MSIGKHLNTISGEGQGAFVAASYLSFYTTPDTNGTVVSSPLHIFELLKF